ncbi:hypothetical protein T484DRAFT_1821985 [Baffinella frigidus]|nr:hypothetical protein T484DRAFT_1821985 [Cryptophyta sp. CCMP2293]
MSLAAAQRSPDNKLPPLPLCPYFERRAMTPKPSPPKYARSVSKMIALSAAAQQQDAPDSVKRTRSEPLLALRRSREPSASRIMPAFSPIEERFTVSATYRSRDLPGTKILLARSGTLVHSTRQRHGGFSAQPLHPVLASRHKWRTAAASCLATHDESLLCELSSTSCPDAPSTAPPPAANARSDIAAACRRLPVAPLLRVPVDGSGNAREIASSRDLFLIGFRGANRCM